MKQPLTDQSDCRSFLVYSGVLKGWVFTKGAYIYNSPQLFHLWCGTGYQKNNNGMSWVNS